eukprot:703311-Rhodomonas_salina.1
MRVMRVVHHHGCDARDMTCTPCGPENNSAACTGPFLTPRCPAAPHRRGAHDGERRRVQRLGRLRVPLHLNGQQQRGRRGPSQRLESAHAPLCPARLAVRRGRRGAVARLQRRDDRAGARGGDGARAHVQRGHERHAIKWHGGWRDGGRLWRVGVLRQQEPLYCVPGQSAVSTRVAI